MGMMSHVTLQEKSCHKRQLTLEHETCHTWLGAMCHLSLSRVTAVHESCHTDKPVISRSICPRFCACVWACQCVFVCVRVTSRRGVCVCVFLGEFKCVCATSEGEFVHVHVFRCVFIYVSVTLGRRVCVRARFLCMYLCVRARTRE